MIILADTADLLRLTSSGAVDLDVHASWVDLTVSSGAIDAGLTNSKFSTAQTNATIVGSPGAGVRRNVKYVCVTNIHASTSVDVTINVYDGTNSVEQLRQVTLAPQETIVYNDGTWFVYDANGGVKTDAVLASDTVPGRIEIASQAELEAGTDVTRAVTPGRQHFHPSAAKFWVDAVGTGLTINASYNVTSLTDTGAGLLTVNIATDFAAANYCVVAAAERASTALTVTNVQDAFIRNAGQLAGSILVESADHTATTMVQEDPASYFVVGFGDQA